MEILEQIQKSLSNNVWKPDYITLVDSDPRWRALDVIEKEKGIKIEWFWEDTDFTEIGCNPIVVEFSTTKDDKIKFKKGLSIIKEIVRETEYEIITGNKLIIVMKRKQAQ